MNRVFKVIWNRTKGCYVVVAETAKNMTKRSSLSVVFSKMVGATAVAVMLTGVMMPTDALGAPIKNGVGATAENDGGIAIGDNTASTGDYSISVGTGASVGRGDTDEGRTLAGIAIGRGATVTVDDNKGKSVPANQRTGGIAIGQSATTTVVNAIAIGSGTSADGAQAVAIGRNSYTSGNNTVAIGNSTRVRSTNGFALGNEAWAGIDENGTVVGKDNDQAFGSNARAWGGSSMALGNDAKAGGGGAISMGNGSQSRGDWAVAIGNGSKALKQGSSALGTNATTNSSHSTALGWGSTTNGYADIAAGDGSVASGGNSLAIGVQSSTSTGAVGAVALGLSSKAEQTNSMALGVSANAAHERSVALGANSKTDATVSTPNQLVNGLWYKNYAGGSADSTISVGSDTVKRTITNVAAGRVNAQSTDAINGSQLYGVANTLGNLASTTKGILGGNAALDPDTGNLSMSNIGNTGKGTIHDAIKFNKDTIDKGLNFDANTGGAKNNLLGSKVTIKGDGSNINAAITQANGDTTINMTLGNSIKVGTAKPVTIDGTTGYVTGLQNKDWNVDSPVAVSGRAATEDQLKKVNDKVNTNKAAIDKNAGDINTNKQNITKNAGDIANNKTDIAKNKQDISTINTKINKGLNFAGDTGTVSNRQLGDTVTVKGGATGTLSDGNIGVVSDGNGTLNVKLAKTLTGLDSVTAGNTKIDNSGLTVGGKTYVSPTGLNANNQKITNVANGSDPNDAVNYSQLQAAIGGTAKASTVKPKDANVTVTESTNAAGGKEYTVGLGNKITVGTAHPVTVDGDAGHVTGLTNIDWNVDNPVAESGRGATEDQLKKVNDKVNTNKTAIDKGLNFDGDSGAVINKKLGEKLSVKGGATGTLSDGNIGVESDGNGTLNVKLAKTLTGLESVTAGGTTINNGGLTVGGKNYVSPNGINANDQKITNVANGDVAANSKDAVNGGQLHQVKQDLGDQITNTKNDLNNKIDNTKTDLINIGLRFNADNDDEKTNKLGTKVTVNGDDNITTEITQTGDDTKIALKLKKDLNVRSVMATDTVKAGDVTMGKQADGANPGNTGNYITGLDNKTWNPGNVVPGRAATEDQLKQALADQTATGLKFDANVGGVKTNKLGSTVIVQGEGKAADTDYSGENIKTFIKQDAATGNTTIDVKMSKNLKAESVTVAKDGKNGVSITGPDTANGTDGKVAVTDKNGKDAVSMSGKDGIGHIGLNGKDGRSADISVEKGDPDIEGNAITRIKYQDENGKTHQVATKDDGMKYGGDSGAVINKKLNEQVNVIGGITDVSKLTTEDNLGVVSDGSNNLKVRMAKDLKGLETVTTKDAAGNTTVVNGGGMKITPASGNPVSLTKDGLDNGGNKITNVAAGTDPTDAVNKSQLDQAAAAATTTVTAGDNIKVTPSDNPNGSKNYEVSLKDQVTLGSDPKKQIAIDGNAGTIKAGDKVEIDGDKGIIKVGKDGKDGVSITGPDAANGTDGKVGVTGKDGKDAVSMSGKDGVGHIGLNGKDGRSADISVEKGDPDIEGNEITRIKYQDENGKTHQVATKDDGMKYGGDSGAVINKKLNEQVNVIGGITDASKLTTEDNLGVVSDGTGNLKVRMAKDLKGLESVTTKDAAGNTTVMNGGGVTITPASGNAVSLTKDGLNNGGNTITNVAAGVNGTDAVNVNQLKGATDKMANAINAVAGETQRVGAHAAAMSALKPIQYDPLEPTQVMAGIGNYRGETAAALGVAHYTAEDTMFHVGVSVGSHHNMVNAGVTHKFGNSDAKKAIPERYKGGPISSVYVLQDEVTALKAENARMQESLNELSSVKEDNEQMKAQIALLMQQAGLTK